MMVAPLLESLTGRQLFIVWCMSYWGMSVRETARYQGINHKTVLESLGRGRYPYGVRKKWRPYLSRKEDTP